MAPLKLKGDRAEIEVARDLIRRDYRIAIPYGEDWNFDLIFARPRSRRPLLLAALPDVPAEPFWGP